MEEFMYRQCEIATVFSNEKGEPSFNRRSNIKVDTRNGYVLKKKGKKRKKILNL